MGEEKKSMEAYNNTPTLGKMVSLSSHWEQEADLRFAFLKCYGMMTDNMISALNQHRFVDSDWVHVLIEHFADYYFRALDSFTQQEASSPRVWQITFRAAQLSDLQLVQHLLLGVNAHINYDLVFAVVDLLTPEWKELSPTTRAGRYQDYCLVNEIIGHTIDEVQDEILEHDSQVMKYLDMAFINFDEWLISRVITNWRDQVWNLAIQLLACEDEKNRVFISRKVELRALNLANWIVGKPFSRELEFSGK